uniref:Uncharacterized protein n=1 Tax=Lactuca sativa TaxID=4236 RepID=A0A9R1V5U6_LACSA|nr:hypothetical protein LSAT_V11C600318390 [Lactuca sativa]
MKLTINFSVGYDAQPRDKFKRDSLYIDKQEKLRNFNHKKVSRKRCMYKSDFFIISKSKGHGWKYGLGFVDGIFPVLSPDAQQILNFMKKETDVNKVWDALSSLPPTHTTWDDIISVVQFRLNKRWDPIILLRTILLSLYYIYDILVCSFANIYSH